jgi:hypothetical protein
MRWIQRINADGTSRFEPRDAEALSRDGGSAAVHGDIQPFVSPVDGSVISDRKQLREHNARNNVVNSAEFGTQHWDEKRKERDRFYSGEHTRQESFARKQEIYNTITRLEREG